MKHLKIVLVVVLSMITTPSFAHRSDAKTRVVAVNETVVVQNRPVSGNASDAALAVEIKRKLAGLSIPIDELVIVVNNGVVIISGPIASVEQRDLIVQTVRGVNGVRSIQTNKLVINNGVVIDDGYHHGEHRHDHHDDRRHEHRHDHHEKHHHDGHKERHKEHHKKNHHHGHGHHKEHHHRH